MESRRSNHRRNLSADNAKAFEITPIEVKLQRKASFVDHTLASLTQSAATSPTKKQGSDSSDDERRARKMAKKEQRISYKEKKKQASIEVRQLFLNQDMTITAGYLRLRNSIKNWVRLYGVVKPGILLLFRDSRILKSKAWVGTVMLNSCHIIERPSKKDGYSLKLFHPLGLNFWAKKGPRGQTIGNIKGVGLPNSYLIIRAEDYVSAKGWIDSLNFARNSNEFTWNKASPGEEEAWKSGARGEGGVGGVNKVRNPSSNYDENDESDQSAEELDEEEIEKIHFQKDLEGGEEGEGEGEGEGSYSSEASGDDSEEADGDQSPGGLKKPLDIDHAPTQTTYVKNQRVAIYGDCSNERIVDDTAQAEPNLVWSVINQLRGGIDLSHISLPVLIFEPQSLLERFAGYFYHADLLEDVLNESEPFIRMMNVIKFYISGFYKKPKGVKKPFNPTLGEIHRCYWQHKDGSKTYYIAECVSHHPPIFCFHLTNRKLGFSASGSVLSGTKFYGNSLAAVFTGSLQVLFLERNETYTIELPHLLVRGILVGKMTLEYAGKAKIACDKTGYSAELNFLVRPVFGNGEKYYEAIDGKVRFGKKVVASLEGKYTGTVYWTKHLKDIAGNDGVKTGEKTEFWKVDEDTYNRRLENFVVSDEELLRNESRKVWKSVVEALDNEDIEVADRRKLEIEEAQRERAKERRAVGFTPTPIFFEKSALERHLFHYKYRDERPWDPNNDIIQYEYEGVIKTLTKIQTPLVKPTQGYASAFTFPAVDIQEEDENQGSEKETSTDDISERTTSLRHRRPRRQAPASAPAPVPGDGMESLETSLRELKEEMTNLTNALHNLNMEGELHLTFKMFLLCIIISAAIGILFNASYKLL